jgi:hypothetical protein
MYLFPSLAFYLCSLLSLTPLPYPSPFNVVSPIYLLIYLFHEYKMVFRDTDILNKHQFFSSVYRHRLLCNARILKSVAEPCCFRAVDEFVQKLCSAVPEEDSTAVQ